MSTDQRAEPVPRRQRFFRVDALKNPSWFYPLRGIFYFATHPFLYPLFKARLLPCALLSLFVLTNLFLWTYLPQVAFLALFHPSGRAGLGAWANAAILVLGEGAAVVALLFEAFFVDETLVDVFDAVLVAEGVGDLVARGRVLLSSEETADDPVKQLGRPNLAPPPPPAPPPHALSPPPRGAVHSPPPPPLLSPRPPPPADPDTGYYHGHGGSSSSAGSSGGGYHYYYGGGGGCDLAPIPVVYSPFSARQIIEFVVLLPLNFVPVVGAPAFLLLVGYRAGPLHHHRYFALLGLTRAGKRRETRRRRLAYTWFGTAALLLQLVPGLSMAFLLTTAAGSALWAADLEKARAARAREAVARARAAAAEAESESEPGYRDEV